MILMSALSRCDMLFLSTYVSTPDDTQLMTSTYTVTTYLISIPYVTLSPALEMQIG